MTDQTIKWLRGLAEKGGKGVVGNIDARSLGRIADDLERLRTENWQLRQACGYPIPADKETINNPFKCGICDARAQSIGMRT